MSKSIKTVSGRPDMPQERQNAGRPAFPSHSRVLAVSERADAELDEPNPVIDPTLNAVSELLAVDLSMDDKSLMEFAVSEFSRAAWTLARAGVAFVALRQRLPHGEFERALEARGIASQRAREAMRVAAMLQALPEDMARRIASVRPSHAIELLRVDAEVVEQLVEEGALDGDQPLSVRELRKRLARALSEKAHVEKELAANRQTAARVQQMYVESELPPFAREARKEGVIAGERIAQIAEHLEDVVARTLLAQVDHPHAARFQTIAANTLLHSTAGPAIRVINLLTRLMGAYGDTISPAPLSDHLLEPFEQADFELHRKQITALNLRERTQREDERANSQDGRKGRKRGVKS